MSDASKPKPFILPNRQHVTKEPDPGGRWSAQFPEMIGYSSQGGGKVPADFGWNTNPKQWQEELTPQTLAERFEELRILPPKKDAPALPASGGPPALPSTPKP
ncbi:hypothetical protein D7Y13_35435 [Corallococcus praedator]|uniref:Uncharacterized protein n=1 Tax=Corallococcus praedator TaxID=2316724 RepID=A0ABX9Q9M9_9BACT|nr:MULTISPECIES: hypothetical protein [Corallococcus]RKH02278.1 hypothetical protein D7X74_37245 [Corallococcus sp. CA047B]RKH22631.1 hypothetical protein D7X75_35125 [Corallococcus sp. CA031C]RKH92779.1 hypothetical protein D7Y13_35435 [Corallococcus praedator]